MNIYWCLIVALCFTLPCSGQNQKIREYAIDVNISLKNDKLKIIEAYKINREVLEHSDYGISEVFYYSDFEKLLEYEGYSLVKRAGKKTKKMKATGVRDYSNPLDELFFSTRRRVAFDYPVLEPGTNCIATYKKEITDPHFLTLYELQETCLVDKFKFSISYPKEVEIGLELTNFDDLNTQIISDTTSEGIVHQLTVEAIQPKHPINKVFSSFRVYPFITTWIKSVETKKHRTYYGRDVNDLYSWYNEIIAERLTDEINQEIKDTIDVLIKDTFTDQDKIDVIYNWVQTHISYFARLNGMNGFVPQPMNLTFKSRRGDCKAMSLLLKGMLSYVNIPSHLTWVGTRSKNFTYTETPTIIVDNHMICAIPSDTTMLYLDATHKNLLSSEVRPDIQGKQALVGLSKDSFNLVNLPIHPMETNTKIDTIELRLIDNTLKANVSSKLKGYYKYNFLDLIESKKHVVDKDYLKTDGYDANCDLIRNGKWKKADDAIYSAFNCTLNQHILKTPNKLFINLNVIDFYEMLQVEDIENREIDIEEYFKFIRSMHLELPIPKGYHIGKLLKDVDLKYPFFELMYTFKNNDGKLILDCNIKIDFIELESKDFADYKVFLDHLRNLKELKIILEKDE